MDINAKNYSDLLYQLTNFSVSVAPRAEGRTKKQTENWIGKRLLPTLAKIGFIDFPVSVIHRDRPDLRIKTPKASIGIELTEIVPCVYAKAVAIRNRYYPNVTVDRSIFSWGKQFSSKAIHNHLKKAGSKPTSTVWLGDSVEQEWAEAANSCISRKTKKLNKPEFTLFRYNCLSAYTSSPGPMLKVRNSCSLLKKPGTFQGKYKFDVVFLLTSKELVVLTDTGINIENQIVI